MTHAVCEGHEAYAQAEERARVWSHRDQINRDFNSLANFFAVAQALLVGAAANLLDKPRLENLLIGLVLIGVLLTSIWWLVQAKQYRILNELKSRCEECLPEYKETHTQRSNARVKLRYSNTRMLAHVLPFLFLATWGLLVAAVISQ